MDPSTRNALTYRLLLDLELTSQHASHHEPIVKMWNRQRQESGFGKKVRGGGEEIQSSAEFQRGDRVSTPRLGRASHRPYIPPINHNCQKSSFSKGCPASTPRRGSLTYINLFSFVPRSRDHTLTTRGLDNNGTWVLGYIEVLYYYSTEYQKVHRYLTVAVFSVFQCRLTVLRITFLHKFKPATQNWFKQTGALGYVMWIVQYTLTPRNGNV